MAGGRYGIFLYMQTETRACQSCKGDFVIEPADFEFYEQMKVPAPTWCPHCRMMRRMAFQGYNGMYKRKCDFTGEMVISNVHESSPHKIYKQDVWWSDKWDPKEYGRDVDFSRPFLEQWRELFLEVPLPSLYTEYSTMVNSEYCNAAATLKNCYLCFRADGSEDCAYCRTISFMKDCFDLSFSDHCELSYDSSRALQCFKTYYSHNVENCQNVWFSRDLSGCSNCVGCVNLRNKQYCIFNEQYSKEDYEKKLAEFDFGSHENAEKFKKQFEEFSLKQPRKEFTGRNVINSSGDYLYNVKNVKNSFMVLEGEDCRYVHFMKPPTRNCMDFTMFGFNAEWIYDSTWVGIGVNNIKFGFWDYKAHHQEYTFGCHSSGNMFGCVGIRLGEYCILNKQYTKEEYQELVPKIKKHMDEMPYTDKMGRVYKYGELFPIEFSPWAYNETLADDWFPITKEEALKQGYKWLDPDKKDYQEATAKIPDHIKDVSDDILKEILKCVSCGKNYRLIKLEVDFYRQSNLPIPRRCHNCREKDRINRFNRMALYDRKCAKCNKDIKTSYSPKKPDVVYCEGCYHAEFVS